MKNTLILIVALSLGLGLCAQTYASPELKAQAEKHDAEKKTRLGASEIGDAQLTTPTPAKPAFDKTLLEGAFTLSNVEVVNWEKDYTEDYAISKTKELQTKYERYDLFLTKNLTALVRVVKGTEFSKYKIYTLDKPNDFTLITNCETCEKTSFTIFQIDGSRIVVNTKADDGDTFTYQYTFTQNKD